MNELFLNSTTIGIVLSLFTFHVGTVLKKKTKLAVMNPLLIAIILTILFIRIFHVEYENYNQSASYLSYLLTPATVSLAIPLYQQLEILKRNFWAIMVGVLAGMFTSLVSVLAPITVLNPATTIARLLIAPSNSPISIAFAVPMACEDVPNAKPFATGCLIRNTLHTVSATIFPNTPVMMMTATDIVT